MDSVVQYLLNHSRLEITLVRITECTADSFNVSVEAQVTSTGPVGSIIDAMLVDLVYLDREFGKMLLPRVKTRFNGAHVHFYDQTIHISDMAIWLQLLSDSIHNEKLMYQLRNGEAHLKGPFGTTAQCGYNKDIHVLGMNGFPVLIKDVDPEEGKVVMTMRNLSTFEIDYGPTVFEIQEGGEEGQWRTIARLKGDFFTKRGEFHVPLEVETVSLDDETNRHVDGEGEVNGSVISPAARKLGLDVEKTYYFQGVRTEKEGAWTNEAIKLIRSPVLLTEKFISLY
ncbi:hypothetical protein SMACR_02374 [Sordaria macrospora]|uniref:WGS project CABT00000000 data, contig 2.3 n=2 Tax=Sordaria macrospora TaxID=5147 RepID=F7VPD8_SORMK|nr:uncharacterized protein SMAC_02374 [Sordaria macrospora k-hell]KAA8631367.1 hypothetical protein SMACR_02374 [Sordaria macrospora]KAH7626930.1 hypothetical protein B0T09DRAFT_36508 [Sordaria sp. MPI-SDFR-AT-0083]WPJ64758.1 hypothetical protein SMAC4_02374 [Sordaria macrospora]CCC07366.1 unnamed protein product [Sordaria macrospora k-hell]